MKRTLNLKLRARGNAAINFKRFGHFSYSSGKNLLIEYMINMSSALLHKEYQGFVLRNMIVSAGRKI